MSNNIKIKMSAIDRLMTIHTHLSEDLRDEKLKLLALCSEIELREIKLIKRYHDVLLFLLAYAENPLIYELAKKEMIRLCDETARLPIAKKEALSNSGIGSTATQGTFSFALMKWLTEQFPDEISIHSFDESGVHPKDLLKHVLNDMEFEVIGESGLSRLKWLEKVSGTKNKNAILKWLISSVAQIQIDPGLKEQIFESVKLFITIQPGNHESGNFHFSRGFSNISVNKRYYHQQGLLKKFDELALINKKLPPEKKLNTAQKEEILKAARVALILLNRETDPITYGSSAAMKVFDLEHGLSIALFSIHPQMRLAIESYIGFMMFKNGHPMSYGGAWLFGRRSLIGINIFEAFRGGESAFVFAQLLRTYKQAFGAEQFEVEPYQFGKNNPEGLQSGAFWFYHRFGFRPVDKKLFHLAEQEHLKILGTKGYRTPIEILKQFTRSNIEVNFGRQRAAISPMQISHFITDFIAAKFKGDRVLAFKRSREVLKTELGIVYSKLNKAEQFGFRKLSVFAAVCLDFETMKAADKKLLIQLIKEKGTSEFKYTWTVNKFPLEKYFVKALKEFAQK